MVKTNETVVEAKEQGRSGFFSFLAESIREMRRVRWPKRHDVVTYTAAALIVCVVLGVLIWGFDLGVGRVMTLIGVD